MLTTPAILRAVFVLEIFEFLSARFGQVERRLGQKYKVSFKIDDDRAWETINCNTHIAQYSRSKGKQAMKFCQLIEYNMRNIFLEKSYTKCCRETITRPFSKKLKLSVTGVCFYCMPSLGKSKYIETKLQTTYSYLIQKPFLEKKEV